MAGKLNLSKTEVEVEVTCVQSAIGIILKTISAGGTGFDGSGLWGDTRAGQICSVGLSTCHRLDYYHKCSGRFLMIKYPIIHPC